MLQIVRSRVHMNLLCGPTCMRLLVEQHHRAAHTPLPPPTASHARKRASNAQPPRCLASGPRPSTSPTAPGPTACPAMTLAVGSIRWRPHGSQPPSSKLPPCLLLRSAMPPHPA